MGQHENIEILSFSEVEEVSGHVGNFKVKVRKKARYVKEELCTGCGLCQEKCPARNIPSEFDCGIGSRKAIYMLFPQAIPRIPVIDKVNCIYFQKGRCRACEKLCPRGAVDFEQEDRILDLEVGVIIVATGFDLFDCTRAPQYGYGRLDNVLTSLEFERMINSQGPTGGKVLLKDGRVPESVAILHCIGSRDENYNEYCSRVCCMYSLKFAHLVRDSIDAQVYELYIDMRTFGKGYEEFYKRLMREDVIFIRGKGAEVTDVAESPGEEGKLIVKCEDTLLGELRRIPVDMVILSNGLEPRRDAAQTARLFGLSRSKDGFFLEKHPKLAPVETASDGIFIAGACQGPKDIPDTVAQAGAAAAVALSMMDMGKWTLEPSIAQVDVERCSGCGECLLACPYKAIELVEGRAQVSETLCKGCGTCVGHCLPKAIRLLHFTDEQLVAEMQGALSEEVA
ncbi:MAG: 4Fe-4S dicluster domain-containing protein [Anaerolineae bacterium]